MAVLKANGPLATIERLSPPLLLRTSVLLLPSPAMAPLTVQYLEYVEVMRTRNFDLATDYLVMAAMLIEIKSRVLLPRPKAPAGEEAKDPRAELVRRLIEYEQMKAAALELDEMPQAERDFVWVNILVEKTQAEHFPDVAVEDLGRAWQSILRQAKLHRHHTVKREELSVRQHMGGILRALRQADQNGVTFVEFVTLFDPQIGVSGVVVNFLALLELARQQLISFSQTAAFSPIYVRLAFSPGLDTDVDVADNA